MLQIFAAPGIRSFPRASRERRSSGTTVAVLGDKSVAVAGLTCEAPPTQLGLGRLRDAGHDARRARAARCGRHVFADPQAAIPFGDGRSCASCSQAPPQGVAPRLIVRLAGRATGRSAQDQGRASYLEELTGEAPAAWWQRSLLSQPALDDTIRPWFSAPVGTKGKPERTGSRLLA